MHPAKKIYYLLRYMGPRFAWTRTRIALQRRLGTQRRHYRPTSWDRIDLRAIVAAGVPSACEPYAEFKRSQSPPFLFPLGRPPTIPQAIRSGHAARQPAFAQRMRLLAEQRCVYFFHTPSPQPIDWYNNALTGGQGVADRLWCDIPQFVPQQGDTRTIWEPSRAAWAIDVARARAYGFDADVGRLFWHWVDSWMNACPPFMGVQWYCGQEAAVRLIAIATGFWSLADESATTPQRWTQFARLAWVTGHRIFNHIDYAVSQKNNHAISEACGLLLVSQLFPEFRDAPKWRACGRRILERELRRQIYADGSYVQHSMNYERVMLHGATLALRLAELRNEPLAREHYDRLGRCNQFLFQMMDRQAGHVPNYGNNDGALVLPLNECDFNDFRPIVQATYYLTHRRRLLAPGPWDEDLLWLFGPNAVAAEQASEREPTSTAFETGGYYTIRRRHSWALIRCHSYRDRPGQNDNLHLDLWWRGQNVLQDSGSYQYYASDRPDLPRYFTSPAAHNTVEIAGVEPCERVSHFLWFPWPRANKRHYDASNPERPCFVGESYAYDRPPWNVLHRRTLVALAEDSWLVIDDLLGSGTHQATLRWHMIDVPLEPQADRRQVRLDLRAGRLFVAVSSEPASVSSFEIVRGRDEPGRVQGFFSRYYGQRLPNPTLEATVRSELPQRLLTAVGPQEFLAIKCTGVQDARETWELQTASARYAIALAVCARNADPLAPTMRVLDWKERK